MARLKKWSILFYSHKKTVEPYQGLQGAKKSLFANRANGPRKQYRDWTQIDDQEKALYLENIKYDWSNILVQRGSSAV